MSRTIGLFALLGLAMLVAACEPAAMQNETEPLPGTGSGELGERSIDTMICPPGDDQQQEFAEQFNFTCVEQCPQGMDEFAGQLGNLCIQHYSHDELQQLPACETKNDCSAGTACAYATHATTDGGTLLEWDGAISDRGLPSSALRCVPHDYQEFLIHTMGFTSVDENGDTTTMIA